MGFWDDIKSAVYDTQYFSPMSGIFALGALGAHWVWDTLTGSTAATKLGATPPGANLPTTEEGTTVPIVYGRCRVTSPMLVWNSGLESILTDNSNNGATYTIYGIDMLFVLGIPMGALISESDQLAPYAPRLFSVFYGDKTLPAPQNGCLPAIADQTFYTSQLVYQPDFNGGPGAGGGLVGIYSFLGGYKDQSLGPDVQASMGTPRGGDISVDNIPGYRGKMTCALTKLNVTSPYVGQSQGAGTNPVLDIAGYGQSTFVIGESPSPQGFNFEVACYGNQLFSMANPGHDFGGDADPAEVIYDILASPWSRTGAVASLVDLEGM